MNVSSEVEFYRALASQIKMLRAIKDGVQQLSSTGVRVKYHLGNSNTVGKNKKILQHKEIVEMKVEDWCLWPQSIECGL